MPFGPQRSRPGAASTTLLARAAFLVFLFLFPVTTFCVAAEADAAETSFPEGGAAPTSGDTLKAANPGADSASHATAKSRSDSLIVVKHSFEHREQIITGSVIMTCLMLMMVTMNNYNPR